MELIYTSQALDGLEEALSFIAPRVSFSKLVEIRNRILDKADSLLIQPNIGQKEPYLEHLGMNHRRIVESHYKIIYRIEDDRIYIIDIFDSRQDPDSMNG